MSKNRRSARPQLPHLQAPRQGNTSAMELLLAAMSQGQTANMRPSSLTTNAIVNVDVSYLDSLWLDENGRLKPLPAEQFLPPVVPDDHRMLWCHHNARYLLPTVELLTWLKDRIGGRSAIELAAGNADLGYLLGIKQTDSYGQQNNKLAQKFYALTKHPPTKPKPDVECLEAIEALDKYKPQVAVAGWLTRKFIDGVDVDGMSEASLFGVIEEDILSRVETYIHIGSLTSHSEKTLLKAPHEKIFLPGHISRTRLQENNVIYVWDRNRIAESSAE